MTTIVFIVKMTIVTSSAVTPPLEDKLGTKPANTFMELIPHQPADELVTRTDMHAFGTGLRGEMAELRGELTTEMAELRTHLERLVVGGMVANAIAVVTALVA